MLLWMNFENVLNGKGWTYSNVFYIISLSWIKAEKCICIQVPYKKKSTQTESRLEVDALLTFSARHRGTKHPSIHGRVHTSCPQHLLREILFPRLAYCWSWQECTSSPPPFPAHPFKVTTPIGEVSLAPPPATRPSPPQVGLGSHSCKLCSIPG